MKKHRTRGRDRRRHRTSGAGRSNMKPVFAILILGILILGVGMGGLWYYTTNSYMVMAGEPEVTIGLHGYYADPGVTARISGRDVTDRVRVESDLDPGVPGTYEITYSAGNFHEVRTVTVLDRMSPELELDGGPVTMLLGEEFQDPGFHAKADDGTDLTDRVRIGGADFRRAGTYELTYTVTDGQGRSTRLTRELTIQPNTEWDSPGFPICMYHYVYDEKDPPEDLNRRYGNYISTQALMEEINWLKSEHYYFPTWAEVRDYVDGKLMLPEKSIVLTFDDGEKKTLEKLVPVLDACRVPATSFLITSKKGETKVKEYTSEYLLYESHTHDMHRAGGVPGHRGIFPVISEEEGMADLQKSIEICGSSDAFAYPYGDYSESAKAMLQRAGFLCAVTTQPGWVHPGMDPLLLPRQRMSLGQTLDSFRLRVAE